MTGDLGLTMKYAVVERERRFLPDRAWDLSSASRVLAIEDRYIESTRLRLRTVREPGRAEVRKLGQKVRLAPGDPSLLAHTTMYLDEGEHTLLSSLPAVTLRKTRHVMTLPEGLDVAVDVFAGPLTGLTLVEVDLGAAASLSQTVPASFGLEVTDVEELTGYALACLDADALAGLLATYEHEP